MAEACFSSFPFNVSAEETRPTVRWVEPGPSLTLVTFLVSLPMCTLVGLGEGLRLFLSFSSLLGGLDLIEKTKYQQRFVKSKFLLVGLLTAKVSFLHGSFLYRFMHIQVTSASGSLLSRSAFTATVTL